MSIFSIQFSQSSNIEHAINIFDSILHCADARTDKLSISTYFRDTMLIDKFINETNIDYVEAATWQNYLKPIKGQILEYLTNSASAWLDAGAYTINISDPGIGSMPLTDWDWNTPEIVDISIMQRINGTPDVNKYNVAENEIAKLLYNSLGYTADIKFCQSIQDNVTRLYATIAIDRNRIPGAISRIIEIISPDNITGGFKLKICKNNREIITNGIVDKFDSFPKNISVYGWGMGFGFKTPFAINSLSIQCPVLNCSYDSAMEMARYAHQNSTVIPYYSALLNYIPWQYPNGITSRSGKNYIWLEIMKNKMKINVGIDRYKETDPGISVIRHYINEHLNIHKIKL
ncbi:MAG: hypothetical protein WAX69_04860 [Victivallales bacterium]